MRSRLERRDEGSGRSGSGSRVGVNRIYDEDFSYETRKHWKETMKEKLNDNIGDQIKWDAERREMARRGKEHKTKAQQRNAEYIYELESWKTGKTNFSWQKQYVEKEKQHSLVQKNEIFQNEEQTRILDNRWERNQGSREERKMERKKQLEKEMQEQERKLAELQQWKREREEKLQRMRQEREERYQNKSSRLQAQLEEERNQLIDTTTTQIESLRQARKQREADILSMNLNDLDNAHQHPPKDEVRQKEQEIETLDKGNTDINQVEKEEDLKDGLMSDVNIDLSLSVEDENVHVHVDAHVSTSIDEDKTNAGNDENTPLQDLESPQTPENQPDPHETHENLQDEYPSPPPEVEDHQPAHQEQTHQDDHIADHNVHQDVPLDDNNVQEDIPLDDHTVEPDADQQTITLNEAEAEAEIPVEVDLSPTEENQPENPST